MSDHSMHLSVGSQKADVLRHLLATMIDASASPAQRQAAKQSLRRVGDQSIVVALEQLIEESNDTTLLADAGELLGFMPATGDTQAALVKLLWHDSSDVRRIAIQSLARIGDRPTANILTVLISDSQDPATIFDPADGTLAEQARRRILSRSSN